MTKSPLFIIDKVLTSILIGLQAIHEETTGHGSGETGGAGEDAQGRSQNDLSNRYKKLKEELENQK